MRKIALFIAIAAAAIACKPAEQIVPEVKVNSTSEDLVIPTEGGEVQIAFEANVEWTATLDAASKDWCTLSPDKGSAGVAGVKLIASENATNDNRVATVTIKAQTASKTVSVTQLQKDALVVSVDKAFEIPADGGQVKFSVAHNVNLTVTPGADWIVQTKAMQDTEMVFDIAANTGAAREANIVVSSGDLKGEVVVKQEAWAPRFEVSAEELWLPVEGGSVVLTVDANIPFVVNMEENDWITVEEEDDVYTFTAFENTSFDHRVVAFVVVPEDEAYADYATTVYVFQNGHASRLWTVNPAEEYEGYDPAKKVRLAMMDDYLVVANTSKLFLIDPASGEMVSVADMPGGSFESFCVDDAGNVIVATDAPIGGTMTIYNITTDENPELVKINEWNTGNYYGTNFGILRVKGNIKEDAVMSAIVTAGAGGAVLMWMFEDGVCSTWYYTNPPYEVSSVDFGCAAPLGTTFEDGFLYLGYGGDYNIKYLANPILDNKTNTWVNSYTTGYSWMENMNCISTAEFGGKKYAAFTAGCHFSYDDAEAILLDITDPTDAKLVYSYAGTNDVTRNDDWTNQKWTGLGTFSDILLIPTENSLVMVYIDSNFGAMSCIEIR